jgi:HEAT repeat protein
LETRSKDLDFSSHGVEVLKDEEDVKGLIKILKHVRSRKVRAEAAYALAELGEPAVPSLIKALRDKKREVQEETAFALAEVRDERIVEPLIQALKDEDPGVRAKAADALGLLGDKRAVEPLIQALRD